MDHRLPATLEMAREFSRLFVNRRAYTIQSLRPHPERVGGTHRRNSTAAPGRGDYDWHLRHQRGHAKVQMDGH